MGQKIFFKALEGQKIVFKTLGCKNLRPDDEVSPILVENNQYPIKVK